jgi:hypothetical protein
MNTPINYNNTHNTFNNYTYNNNINNNNSRNGYTFLQKPFNGEYITKSYIDNLFNEDSLDLDAFAKDITLLKKDITEYFSTKVNYEYEYTYIINFEGGNIFKEIIDLILDVCSLSYSIYKNMKFEVLFDRYCYILINLPHTNLNENTYSNLKIELNDDATLINYYPQLSYIIKCFNADLFIDIIISAISKKSKNINIIVFDVYSKLDNSQMKLLTENILEFLENSNANRIYLDCDDISKDKYGELMDLLIQIGSKNKKTSNKIKCYKPQNQASLKHIRQTIKQTRKNISRLENLSSNTSLDKLFDKFIQRYQESLFVDYDIEPDAAKRAELYTQNIISYFYKFHNDKNIASKQFIKLMAKGCLDYKKSLFSSNTKQAEIPFNFIFYHGYISNKLKVVPDNCILVFLAPTNRSLVVYGNILTRINIMMNLLKSKQWREQFSKNPLCFGRKNLNYLLSNAVILFAGQYYFDVDLQYDFDNSFFNNMGIYKSTNSTNNYHRIYENNLESQLSTEIKKNKLEGIIIVQSCRTFSNITRKHETIPKIIYLYEHLIQILNKSIWFEDNDAEYKNCDKISKIKFIGRSFEKDETKEKQIIVNNSSFVKTAFNKRKNANKSISFSVNILARLGLTPDLINQLTNVDLDNIGSTYTKMAEIIRTYNLDLRKQIGDNLRQIFNGILTYDFNAKMLTASFSKYTPDGIFYLNLILSFLFYAKIHLKTNEFDNILNINTEIIILGLLFWNGCGITTEELMELLDILKKLYKDKEKIKSNLYLSNNAIKNIPIQLLDMNTFDGAIFINNNPISFQIVDSSNYIDESNIEDFTILPQELNGMVYRNILTIYNIKKMADAPISLDDTFMTNTNGNITGNISGGSSKRKTKKRIS